MQTKEKEVPTCDHCRAIAALFPAGGKWMLCEDCLKNWWEDRPPGAHEEEETGRYVVQCICGRIVKGLEPEAHCQCGRVWTCFQIF